MEHSFKLKTVIRVKEYLESPQKCIDVNEEGTQITIKDVSNRFQPVSFNFPHIYTDESQVNLLIQNKRKQYFQTYAPIQ